MSSSIYNTWLKTVTTDMTVASQPVALLGDSSDSSTTINFRNWGGLALNQGVTYTLAEAEYNAPYIVNTTTSLASMWTGLGGANPGDTTVIQSGIELSYTSGSGPNMFGWIEYYVSPTVGNKIREFTVSQGDLIYPQCWVSDQYGNQDPTGGYATYEIDDLSTGTTSSIVTIQKPGGGTSYVGGTAEFIIERKLTCNTCSTYGPLTDYNPSNSYATMYGLASDSSGGGHDFNTDFFDVINTTDSSGTFLQFAGQFGADELGWEWVSAN